jgi:hypothetical protein
MPQKDRSMLVNIFRGPGRIFAFTPDADASMLTASLGPWVAFKTIEMHRDEPQAGVDVNECLDDIGEYGFHMTDAHERITEKAVAAD